MGSSVWARPMFRSYGKTWRPVQRLAAALAVACVAGLWAISARAADGPVKIVALGDSLIAGFGLPAADTFPVKLQKTLQEKGIAVEIVNAGASGDTASGGLARLDWSVPPGTQAVILELGANDMLRGVDPNVTRAALESIIQKLKARGIEVMLCGMLTPPNLGPDYAKAFNAIYPELATTHGLVFYPFFLDGIAADPKLNLRDGIHPSAAGIAAIVARIAPKVEELVARVRAKRGS